MIDVLRQKLSESRALFHRFGLDDPRLFGLALLACIGLSVLWTGVGVVEKNYELQQKVAVLEEENRNLEIANSNKSLQNEYYKTPEFAELKARRVNGKALPGETVYTIDDSVASKFIKSTETAASTVVPVTPVSKPKYQQNFEAWMRFFFGTES